MKTITLVRHGQSTYNAEERLAGQADIPLTELGIAQAKALNTYLKENNHRFDHAFSSGLQRASDTARYALEGMGITHQERSILNERSAGELTHHLISDVKKSEHAHILATIYHTPTLAYPAGECFLDVVERAKQFVANDLHALSGSIFIASHAITTQGLLVALGQKTVEEAIALKIKNAHPIIITL